MSTLDPRPKKKSGCLARIGKGLLIFCGIVIGLAVLAAILPKKPTATAPKAGIILVPSATPADTATLAATEPATITPLPATATSPAPTSTIVPPTSTDAPTATPLPAATDIPLVPTDTPISLPTDTPPSVEASVPPTEAPQMLYICDHDAYNCSDFSTHAEAQAAFDYCSVNGFGDIHGLDGGDKDGMACESLP
jgi:hypothetical protein